MTRQSYYMPDGYHATLKAYGKRAGARSSAALGIQILMDKLREEFETDKFEAAFTAEKKLPFLETLELDEREGGNTRPRTYQLPVWYQKFFKNIGGGNTSRGIRQFIMYSIEKVDLFAALFSRHQFDEANQGRPGRPEEGTSTLSISLPKEYVDYLRTISVDGEISSAIRILVDRQKRIDNQ